jgi:hypothetical protein
MTPKNKNILFPLTTVAMMAVKYDGYHISMTSDMMVLKFNSEDKRNMFVCDCELSGIYPRATIEKKVVILNF